MAAQAKLVLECAPTTWPGTRAVAGTDDGNLVFERIRCDATEGAAQDKPS
jgi:hypothetical protein